MNIADRMCSVVHEWKAFPRINIDNVANFLFPDWFGKEVHPHKDIPNIAPPWGDAIYFWKYPKGSADVEGIEVLAYCHSDRIWYEEPLWENQERMQEVTHVNWGVMGYKPKPEGAVEGWRMEFEFYDSDTRFQSVYGIDPKVYSIFGGRKIKDGGWPMRVATYCDENGSFIVNELALTEAGTAMGISKNSALSEWMEKEVQGLASVVLFANTFIHCKNTTVQRKEPNVKLAKKQAKKRGIPRLSYHVLVIEPMRKILVDEGHLGRGEKLGRALHICRGHFKDYRDGAGLFGKHKEIYWWEMAVRGDKKEGIAVKDYSVKEVSKR